MASQNKITVEIYRADRQRVAEIEAEMTVEWAASGGAAKKPTPADAIHRALGRVERFQDASKLLDDIHTEACHAIAEGSSISCVLVQKWVEDLYLKWESNDAKLMGDAAPSSPEEGENGN